MVAEKPEQVPLADAIGRLHALFADEAVLKVGHNLKYDIGVLAQHGITIAPYDDTLVMSFALDAGKHQHGLDELAKLNLDHVCISFMEVRSEEHTYELKSLMRTLYAVFCLKKTTSTRIR